MPMPTAEELDTRSFIANWCEHCRCQVIAANISNTRNHKRCGKGPVEQIPMVVMPVRDFANS